MHDNKPAVQKAITFIENYINNSLPSPTHLPPIRKIALSAGVSVVSAWKAVHELQSRGILDIVHGGYIRLAKSSVNALPQQSRTLLKWEKLKSQLYRDIFCGRYRMAELMPSIKELKTFYGVSYGILKKALESLVEENILVPYKKTYKIVPQSSKTSHAAVKFVSLSGDDGRVGLFNQRVSEFISALEKDSAKAGVKLEFLPYSADMQHINSRILVKDPNTIGYIVWVGEWMRFEHHWKLFTAIIFSLAGFKTPIALIDEYGFPSLLSVFAPYRNVKIFTIAAEIAGRDIAQMLLRLGHRRIAYISPFYKHYWSQKRYIGIQQTFAWSGSGYEVVPFVKSNLGIALDSALAMCAFKANEYEMIRRVNTPPLRLSEVLLDYEQIRNVWKPNSRYKKRVYNVKRSFLRLLDLIKKGIDPAVFSQISETVFQNASAEGMKIYLEEQLFEKAFADDSITAWVADNDQTAFAMIEFLHSQGCKVPEHLSVAGFDNNPLSFNYGLTTYSFNIASFAARALMYLFKGRPFSNTSLIEEVEGILIERETTAKPNTSAKTSQVIGGEL